MAWVKKEARSYYFLRSKKNDMCIDVKGKCGRDHTPIITWPKNRGDNQLWYFEEDTSTIRSKLNDKCLTGIPGEGCVLLPYVAINGWQQWCIDGDFIKSKIHPNYVLDIKWNLGIRGRPVVVWEDHGGDNQRWFMEQA
eukprot:GHVU01033652.1.p1 GENE.GHVU01033652.1~~GHVU01033652.1.p1  ORF type:complete len:138 (+),score=13.90 GHVU01033652.1:46-459(+)